MLSRLGFVHAFGHVSARVEGGVVITPTRPPLAIVREADLLTVLGEERVDRLPLETPLHLAIYRSRPDVGAICRIHAPGVAAWAAGAAPPPLLHGFGGVVEPIGCWAGFDLVTTSVQADGAASALGEGTALLLKGNGGLVVGTDVADAMVTAWCLEDRCQVALAAGERAPTVSAEELHQRSRWYVAEKARTWEWLLAVYGDDEAAAFGSG